MISIFFSFTKNYFYGGKISVIKKLHNCLLIFENCLLTQSFSVTNMQKKAGKNILVAYATHRSMKEGMEDVVDID